VVESVTVSEWPHCAKTLKRRGSFDAFDAAIKPLNERRQIVVEVMANPLLVVGDGFDIDQRAREFENVHKPPAGGGKRKRRKQRAGCTQPSFR